MLACLVPVAAVAIGISLLGVNIPYVDQFRFVPLLARAQANALSIADLVAQNNENRPFFPRLIWLALAGVSRYDVRLELWTSLLIAICTFGFFAIQIARTWGDFHVSLPPILLPLMALLVFNLSQWESWLQGFQLVMFLGSACVVTGFFLLAHQSAWGGFAIAVLAGVVGSFSTPNDLLYWPIGLIIVIAASPASVRRIRVALWIVFGAACTFLFLSGWKAGAGFSPAALVADVLPRAYWVTNFLGAPLMAVPHLAFPFGALSILLCLVIARYLAKTGHVRPGLPYLAMIAFVMASGVVISLARMPAGIAQAVASRYLAISTWYWASILALLPLIPFSRIPQRVLFSLIAVCLLWQMGWGTACAKAFHSRLIPAYEAAVEHRYMSDQVLRGVAQPGTYDQARSALKYLADHRLSAYAYSP
jgi:hypothetical protein